MDFNRSTRGFRNNNPGNIRHGNDWRGETNGTDTDFETFTSLDYGIRAIFKLVQTYLTKYKLMTIEQIVRRFAPPLENHTQAYIKAVYKYMLDNALNNQAAALFKGEYNTNIHQNDLITLFVAGIIYVENGFQPFNLKFIEDCAKL